MNHRQRQTEFLRQCLLYDESREGQQLAERIKQVQQKERCVRNALRLMVVLGAVAFAGLAYWAILLGGFPQNAEFTTRLISELLCVIGLVSLICVPVFVVLELVYRRELNQRQEECRRLTSELLESRLGKPRALNGTMAETFVRKAGGVNHAENNAFVVAPKTDSKP